MPGDFFLSNFLTKIGGKVHCMNRLGNLKVQSRHTIFDHARCRKKSVLQSTGRLYPQLNQLNNDTPFLLLCLLYYPLPTLLPALLLPASFPACSPACFTTHCLLLCLLTCLLCYPLPAPMPALRPPACSRSSCLLPCLLFCYPLPATLPALRPLPAL